MRLEASWAFASLTSTVYRGVSRPRAYFHISSQDGSSNAGTRLVSPQIELVVESAIELFSLQRIQPPFSALVRQIQAYCHWAGLKPPHRKTILRRVHATSCGRAAIFTKCRPVSYFLSEKIKSHRIGAEKKIPVNVFKHTNFGNPVSNVSWSFGRITSLNSNSAPRVL